MSGDESDNQFTGTAGVTDPEVAVVPIFDEPSAASRALVDTMPENSCTLKAIEAARAIWTTTAVAGAAFMAYQIRRSSYVPRSSMSWLAPIHFRLHPSRRQVVRRARVFVGFEHEQVAGEVGVPSVAVIVDAGAISAALTFCWNAGPTGGDATVTSSGDAWVLDTTVPTTAMVVKPAAAPADADTVIVEAPPAVTAAGSNDTETPAGTPEADNTTACGLPLVTAVSTKTEPCPPAVTVNDGNETATVKSSDWTACVVRKSAIPDAQYIEDAKVALRPSALPALGAP